MTTLTLPFELEPLLAQAPAEARRRNAAHQYALPSQGAVYDRKMLLAAYDAQAAALAAAEARVAELTLAFDEARRLGVE